MLEQTVLLRHFLFHCQREGVLTGQDLELLVEIKLQGSTGEESGRPVYSNALRQRIKRLLKKFRHAAQIRGTFVAHKKPPKPQ